MSHLAHRPARPWSEEDQSEAERLYRAGLSINKISRQLDRSTSLVRKHLGPVVAERTP